jgi:dTDP-4-dehydrorhamnose reductase
MTKVTLIGGHGLLGQDIAKECRSRGWPISTPSRDEVDVTSANTIEAFLRTEKPDWVINCAAFVAVDDAEEKRDEAFALNVQGAENVAAASTDTGARLVHVSTDYVFGGETHDPYSEDDPPNPLGTYAESKLQGETRVLDVAPDSIVARTAWLYGAGRDNFPLKILRAAISGKSLRLVSDRVGSPTYTKDLAVALADMIESRIPGGIYHVVNEGIASWYDLCTEMIKYAGLQVDIQPAKNSEYPTPAARPMYSVLSTLKLQQAGIAPLPHWKDAVHRFVDELRETRIIAI